MASKIDLTELSFLIYGLGLTGKSVVNFFKKNNIKNFQVWDEKNKVLFKTKRALNLNKTFKNVDYIILSPGISLKKAKYKEQLIKYKKKIITDLDLLYLSQKFHKSIVVTGTNGKSTTCKVLQHILKKKNYNPLLGGNIGTPILSLKIKKNNFLVIEASSFQLEYSKFICPDFSLLLNITNDHLDWHGNMKNYINSKLKIFQNQRKDQYSLVNSKFKKKFKQNKFKGKLIIPSLKNYLFFKPKIKNEYLASDINDENMAFVFSLSKLLKISKKNFLNSLKTFKGLPHRYEIFLKQKNCIFINDSKATTFQAVKYALKNTKNIYWIVGGQPKKNDKIQLKDLKKNIIKSYLIGKSINFFKKQIQQDVKYFVARNLENSIIQILKDIRLLNKKNNSILLSPASASFDQFLNFEDRGNKFKKLSIKYARKYI